MRKFLSLSLIILLILTLIGCQNESSEKSINDVLSTLEIEDFNQDNFTIKPSTESTSTTSTIKEELIESTENLATDTDETWAMYFYLCGSDLETYNGFATADLEEIMSVDLPTNVKIVIQTGGSYEWNNDFVDPDLTQRFVYDSNGLELIEEMPLQNMGEAQTLADFLTFANENYPADNVLLNFWNHGGGSVTGICFDEVFNFDSLDLNEMYEGITAVYSENYNDPPLQMVGFDACLMATVDVAYYLTGLADILVASQELVSGYGWDYSSFLTELVTDTSISTEEFSRIICDTYYDSSAVYGLESDLTLSAIDLNKMSPFLEAYENYIVEILSQTLDNPNAYTKFASAAQRVENYGGNTRYSGYTNMADLGHIARLTQNNFSSAQELIDTLNDVVIYEVNGEYRQEATGLSFYYPYDGDVNLLQDFSYISANFPLPLLYNYVYTGEISEAEHEYIANLGYENEEEQLPELTTVMDLNLEDYPLYVDNRARAVLDIGSENANILSEVTFDLYYVDADLDIIIFLGTDNDIIADYETGIFRDNFRGVWGSIDGVLCFMEIIYIGDDYNTYSIPILLNGEFYNLIVVYNFISEEWSIQGARKEISDEGAASRNIRLLKIGDEIQTLHYSSSYWGDDTDLLEVAVDTIYVDENTSFGETELGDGEFVIFYAMKDSQGNVAYSAPAYFDVINGEIYTYVD